MVGVSPRMRRFVRGINDPPWCRRVSRHGLICFTHGSLHMQTTARMLHADEERERLNGRGVQVLHKGAYNHDTLLHHVRDLIDIEYAAKVTR